MKLHKWDTMPEIACHAAIEVDNVRLGQTETFENIQWVMDWLAKEIFESEVINPSAIIALRQALITCGQFDPQERQAEKLKVAAVVVRDKLFAISSNPLTFARSRAKELEELRQFLLEFSRATSVYESLSSGPCGLVGTIFL